MERPEWFNDVDAQDVIKLLRSFVAILNKPNANERKKPVMKKLSRDNCPGYFDFSNSDRRDYIAVILEGLAQQKILQIRPDKHGDITGLTLSDEHEETLRQWLNMPLVAPQEEIWRREVASSLLPFVQQHSEQLCALGYFGIYSPTDILLALDNLSLAIPRFLNDQQKYSWRQLSARFFFGDSKYLDSPQRRLYLQVLFGQIDSVVKERSLQVSVTLARQPKAILFIENWDTHCWLGNMPAISECFHLVYAAGFRTSARNIRLPGNTTFYFAGDYSQLQHFQNHWFSHDSEEILPAYFWGDLDYSGMEILKTLQTQFNQVQAWRPGYEPMLQAIRSGIGHKPEQTEKENQRFFGATSCDYAQNFLIPAMQETGLMLDQEWLIEFAKEVI